MQLGADERAAVVVPEIPAMDVVDVSVAVVYPVIGDLSRVRPHAAGEFRDAAVDAGIDHGDDHLILAVSRLPCLGSVDRGDPPVCWLLE